MLCKSLSAILFVLAVSGCATTARNVGFQNRTNEYGQTRTPFVSEADREIRKREKEEKIQRLLREIRGESP